jgi:hypothetical protein
VAKELSKNLTDEDLRKWSMKLIEMEMERSMSQNPNTPCKRPASIKITVFFATASTCDI